MENTPHSHAEAGSITDHLQASILAGTDIHGFLIDMVCAAAQDIAHPGAPVSCGITLVTNEQMATVASSDPLAHYLDETQHKIGIGPCLSAARAKETMDITDTATETRWRGYLDAVNHSAVRSIHSVPFDLGQTAAGALNLYSTAPHAFPGAIATRAKAYVEQVTAALRLALHIADLTNSRQGIIEAIVSRTNTTLALGILMARHGCTQTKAFALLQQRAQDTGTELQTAAAALIASPKNPTAP